jgi:hypothetical protein
MRMRSMGLGLLLAVVHCGSASRAPLRSTKQQEVTPSTSSIDSVVVRPGASGLRVSYRFVRPSSTFRFDDSGAEIRKDTWTVLDAGLSLANEGVVGTTPVSSFDVSVTPDSRQRDRIYPALTRVGDGWLIYAPHLRVDATSIPHRLSIDLPSGWSLMGRKDANGELAGDGYVFAGPSSYVHRGAADVVSAPSTPTWLLHDIEESAGATVAFYERRLGAPLRGHPTIVVTHEPDRDGSFHGDTTPGAMMSLRFYGSEWNARDTAGIEVLADFVHHELFHFWNAELAHSSQGDTRPWLHEGGANYAALLASRERGTMNSERFYAALNRHLERCQMALGNRDLRTHGPRRGSDTYACGTVLEWAVDIGLRETSNGQRDALSWWKDILAQAESNGRTYSFESAYALVGQEASRAADALLDAGDERRWAAFAEAARRYGAPMVQSRQASHDLAAALDHVLALHCGRDRGFFTFPDHVKLDTGTHCGVLDGDLEVDSISGFNPITASSAMYDKLRQLCAAKKPIDFSWKGQVVARAPCTIPLSEPTLGWQIRRDGEGSSSRPSTSSTLPR